MKRALVQSILALAMVLLPRLAGAQRKLDLEDLNVKGELMNDNRLKLSARESKKMDERVKFRTNYRSEIAEDLDVKTPPVSK